MKSLTNDNVHYVTVEKVACNFAKAKKDGTAGTHYVVLMLDKAYNILYLASQCEEMGQDVDAMDAFLEMEKERGIGHSTPCCHLVTHVIQSFLAELADGAQPKDVSYKVNKLLSGTNSPFTHALDQATSKAYRMAQARRNYRDARMPFGMPRRLAWAHGYDELRDQALTRLVVDVTGNPWLQVHRGKALEDEKGPRLVLLLGDNVVASRNWSEDNFRLTEFVQRKKDGTLRVPNASSFVAHPEHSMHRRGARLCSVCNAGFKRLGKHVESARHFDKLASDVQRALQVLSRRGLAVVKASGSRTLWPKKVVKNLTKEFPFAKYNVNSHDIRNDVLRFFVDLPSTQTNDDFVWPFRIRHEDEVKQGILYVGKQVRLYLQGFKELATRNLCSQLMVPTYYVEHVLSNLPEGIQEYLEGLNASYTAHYNGAPVEGLLGSSILIAGGLDPRKIYT